VSCRAQGGLTPTRKLRVAYMLPHHNITGGMKCLVEHIRLLRSRGHTTIAVHRCHLLKASDCRRGRLIRVAASLCVHLPAGSRTAWQTQQQLCIGTHGRRRRGRSDTAVRAMPPWTNEEADVDVVCRLHQRLADVYPATNIDVCVVGIFHQVRHTLCSACAH